jgi:hypothetical protein
LCCIVKELSSDSTIALQRLYHLDSSTISSRGRCPAGALPHSSLALDEYLNRHPGPVLSTPRQVPSPTHRAALSTRHSPGPVFSLGPGPVSSTPRPASTPAHFASSGRHLHRPPGPHVPTRMPPNSGTTSVSVSLHPKGGPTFDACFQSDVIVTARILFGWLGPPSSGPLMFRVPGSVPVDLVRVGQVRQHTRSRPGDFLVALDSRRPGYPSQA